MSKSESVEPPLPSRGLQLAALGVSVLLVAGPCALFVPELLVDGLDPNVVTAAEIRRALDEGGPLELSHGLQDARIVLDDEGRLTFTAGLAYFFVLLGGLLVLAAPYAVFRCVWLWRASRESPHRSELRRLAVFYVVFGLLPFAYGAHLLSPVYVVLDPRGGALVEERRLLGVVSFASTSHDLEDLPALVLDEHTITTTRRENVSYYSTLELRSSATGEERVPLLTVEYARAHGAEPNAAMRALQDHLAMTTEPPRETFVERDQDGNSGRGGCQVLSVGTTRLPTTASLLCAAGLVLALHRRRRRLPP